MSPAGSVFVMVVGVWVMCQVFAGDGLGRLLIVKSA